MNVELYTNHSENNAINKNKSLVTTISAIAKGEVSVIKPIIEVHTTSNITNANYCYISEFDRFYFIENITALTGNRYSIQCYVDVLESYKYDILSLEAVIDKQQDLDNANTMYDDGSFKALTKTYTETIDFSGKLPDVGNFILVTAG